MQSNPLLELRKFGQRVWLDYIRRDLIDGGRLAAMMDDDGLAGITSNPNIFEDAIARHDFYDGRIARLRAAGADAARAYQELTTGDVRDAADLLASQWRDSGGRDGLVSLEVSPRLADDARATVEEARLLWQAVARPNLMIKVPGTRAGLAAIEELIAAGISVNVTLLFSVARYRDVVEAFQSGLEHRRRRGEAVAGIQSVASFFISRIDTLVDARIDALAERSAEVGALRGTAAVGCARLAYRYYLAWTDSERWRALAAEGASPQRLLWASTSSKDPAYPEVRYVEELIAPDTVTTLPPATMDAYRACGQPAARLAPGIEAAARDLARLEAAGFDMEEVAAQLERDGVDKFSAAHDSLLATLAERLGA